MIRTLVYMQCFHYKINEFTIYLINPLHLNGFYYATFLLYNESTHYEFHEFTIYLIHSLHINKYTMYLIIHYVFSLNSLPSDSWILNFHLLNFLGFVFSSILWNLLFAYFDLSELSQFLDFYFNSKPLLFWKSC